MPAITALIRCTAHALVAALLIMSVPGWSWQAARAGPGLRPMPPPRDVSTESLPLLQARMQAVEDIIERAQQNQRAILHHPPSKHDRDQLKALAQWQSIEQTAQTLRRQIRGRMRLLRVQSAPEAPHSSQHMQRPLASNVRLTRLDGKRERMAQHRGEVVFVHFWATWCWPCVQEISSLQRLHELFRAQQFVLLAVSLDARKKDLIAFLQKHDLHFPVYFDPGRTAYQQLIGGLEVLPHSLLIDRAGRIVRRYAGAQHLASPATRADITRLLDDR